MANVNTVEFTPFKDQKPGTYVIAPRHNTTSGGSPANARNLRSGLRKKVTVFQQPHYSESFVASILLSIPEGVVGKKSRA
jgi:phosphoglucomutase